MEDVIINFSAETQELEPVVKVLQAIGKITEEDLKKFQDLNKSFAERAKKIEAEKKLIQSEKKDMDALAKSAQDVTKAMAGTAVKQATDNLNKHTAAVNNAVEALYEQGDIMGALIEKYGTAGKALRAMQKELATMAALGQRDTVAFRELAQATAELQDNIGDTRGEISALASDTRKFDLAVEAVRGVAAAFSVAQGAAALFGDENEDLQKALLKVQAAMALATGVQELANIATAKGGIATQAYGLAVKAVDAIQKQFAISSAAAWGVATGGLTIAIGALTALYFRLRDVTEAEKERQVAFGERLKSQFDALKQLDDRQELDKKRAELRGEDLKQIERRQLNERLALILELRNTYKTNMDANIITQKEGSDKLNELEKERLDTLLQLRKTSSTKEVAQAKEIGRKTAEAIAEGILSYKLGEKQKDFIVDTADEFSQLLGHELQNLPPESVPVIPLKVDLIDDPAARLVASLDKFKEYGTMFGTAFAEISQSIFSTETAIMEAEKEHQLRLAGDNVEKREKIEKEFRKRQAEAARKQAALEKTLTIFRITLNIAEAVSNYIKNPATLPLLALAAVTGAAQLAAAIATPLPPIPAFKEGTKGSKKTPAGFKLVGEDGPELMYDGGGKKIITAPDTAKILSMYQIPTAHSLPEGITDSAIGFAMPAGIDYDKLGEVLAEKLRSNPSVQVSIDKNGFSTRIISKNKRVELINARYEA